MSFRWSTSSLEGKLALLVGSAVVLVVTMTTYIESRLSVKALEHSLLEAGSETANALAAELQRGISDVHQIDSLMSSHMEWNHQAKDIALFLAGPEGGLAPYASTRASIVPAEEHRLAVIQNKLIERQVEIRGRRYWSVAAPLQTTIDNKTVKGCVGVWVSHQSVDILRRQNRTRMLIAIPASILVLVVLLRLIFTHLVHRPLKKLQAAMEQVEEGDFDSAAPVTGPDELGFISSRFNRMLDRLRETTKEREELLERVNQFNDELSLNVREATRELEARNQELRHLSAELYYLQRRLARVERLNVAGQMAATFAHKMGTPLNLISAHIQTILQKTPDPHVLQQKLSLVETQVERLTGIFRSFLDETRKPPLVLKPLDLNHVLERLLSAVEPILVSRNVRVEKKLSRNLPLVMGDESQLEQVVSNLLNNSLDAMPNGGTVTVCSEVSEGSVKLLFGDSGEGIPEPVLSQLFRPLFTTKEIGQGSGLGLAIAKEILSAHGASIRARSDATQGTLFFIDFPVPENLPKTAAGL